MLDTLASELEAHAVVLDGELLLVARARGATGSGRAPAGFASRRGPGAEHVADRRGGARLRPRRERVRRRRAPADQRGSRYPRRRLGGAVANRAQHRAERLRVSPWQEVGDGCFRRRYQRFDLNIGVVRGSDALLVLDTRADLRQADELLRELTSFGRPVRWVVNSHWHFDHVFGNQRFVEAAHGEGRARRRGGRRRPRALGPPRPPRDAARRRDRTADPCCGAFYGDEAGDEYDRVVLTPPDHLVADRRHAGPRRPRGRAVDLGRGHTGNDLVVAVPDGRRGVRGRPVGGVCTARLRRRLLPARLAGHGRRAGGRRRGRLRPRPRRPHGINRSAGPGARPGVGGDVDPRALRGRSPRGRCAPGGTATDGRTRPTRSSRP